MTQELLARVFDGHRVLGPRRVRWDAGRILAVEEVDRTPDTDLPCLVPGLIDTHVHLLGHARARERHIDGYTWPVVTRREEQTLHVVANARRALSGGVTTLRELSGDEIQVAVRRAFDDGLIPGPRLRVGGQVGMTAGHGDLFWPPALTERPPVADSPAECRKLVRRWARAGVDAIKIYTSGGVLSIGDRVGWRNQTRAELDATVDEAHALGLRVACHAHTAEGVSLALDLGVDTVEHATGMTDAIADRLAEARTPVAPTLLINDMIAAGEGPASTEARAKAQELVAHRDVAFKRAAERGVNFVLGTDANGAFLDHGRQRDELAAMARVFAWEPIRVLRASTLEAAHALGLGDTTGSIAPGRAADFLVTRDAPWDDLANLAGDLGVYVRGERFA